MSNKLDKAVILCVDDEKSIQISLKTQLKSIYKDKYRYETADNANEALEIIHELAEDGNPIVLIVSDWLMPGMKGDEFLIKVHTLYPKIKTVMLTGHANKEAIENAQKNADLKACIYKPWNIEDLVSVVDDAVKTEK